MESHWKRICRGCCNIMDFRQLKSIFDTPEANIIMVTMFPLQIQENDTLPKQICLECYNKIQETYKFLQQCLNSEKLLRDHVKKVEEEALNASLPVIAESVYEHDISMTSVVDGAALTRIASNRGQVSRVKEFFEAHVSKRTPKKMVARVLDFDQKMSFEESSVLVPQDATINSTVVTDLDSDIQFEEQPIIEVIPPSKPVPVPSALRRTSSRRQFKCLYQSCALRFETKMERRKHLESHLNGSSAVTRSKSNWKCKHCDAKFQNPELLLVHEKQHAAQILHACDRCQKKFKTKTNLVSHQKLHSNTKMSHKCKICLKEFTHVSTLYVHQIIHKPDVAKALVALRS